MDFDNFAAKDVVQWWHNLLSSGIFFINNGSCYAFITIF